MSELAILISIFIIGIFASIFGAMIGGGTLISLPLFIILGLPPQVAIATERLGGLGQTLASFYKFARSKQIIWSHVLPLTIISVVGSVIGANVLLSINPTYLKNMVGILLLILLPLTFLKPNLGIIRNQEVGQAKILIGGFLYFLVQIFAAFFGGGTGILTTYTLMAYFGLTILESSATKIIPWFFLSTVSLYIFAQNGIVDYQKGAILFVGMAIGGYAGTHIAIKIGNIWIKRLFYAFVIISTMKLLFS